MKKTTNEVTLRCPNCGRETGQMKKGYNRSGTQRCIYKECGVAYTINPKKREYSEETKKLAIKMYCSGVSGRGV